MKNCYIYTRVSTMAQTEGFSLEAQQDKLRKYAAYKNLQIAGEYCDAGKSGKNIKGRPAFQQMMEDIANQKDNVSFVLVFKLSRFGRNAADVMKSMQLLLDYEVDLVSIDEAIDSSTQGGRLTLAILSAVAEIERENILIQFEAGRMQKLREGGWIGGPVPFGYRKSDSGLIQEPEEAKMVQRIYQMYLQDEKIYATTIAGILNDEGLMRLSKGVEKPFTYEFITTILDNPFYCGRVLYNRRSNSEEIRRNKKEIIETIGNHEPVVTRELWEQVQEKRKRYSIQNENVDDPDRISVLSGLVKCPQCGKGMIATKNKTKNKNYGGYYKTLYYYRCGDSKKQRGKKCGFRHIYNQEKVDRALLEIIEQITMIPSFEKFLVRYSNSDGSSVMLEEQLKAYRKQLYHQEHEKTRLGKTLDNLDILSDDYDEQYDSIQDEIEEVYDRIEELEKKINATMNSVAKARERVEVMENIKEMVVRFPELYKEMSCAEKREACRLFIEKIEMFPEEREDGRVIKSVSFKFSVCGKDWVSYKDTESEEHICYTVDCSELEITSAEAKATYAELKAYILSAYGLKVSSLYVAQIKKKYGIDVGKNCNLSKKEGARVPKCPKEKEIAIVEALKHFKMLGKNVEVEV